VLSVDILSVECFNTAAMQPMPEDEQLRKHSTFNTQ
jgi:hypothetical protein